MKKTRDLYSQAKIEKVVREAQATFEAIDALYRNGMFADAYSARLIAIQNVATALTLYIEWHKIEEEEAGES